MKRFYNLIGLSALVILALAIQTAIVLNPGDNALLTCPNTILVTAAPGSLNAFCATSVPPTATATSASTQTATPVPTATALPTLAPSATPPALPPVDPAILGTCTAAIHDRYTVVGPDGHLYRTWHPQTVPIDPANPAAGTCTFAHEHGDNPALSLANSSLPAFGYVGTQVGDIESNEGFKVYVVNAGTVNNDGWTANNSTRIVFHQGTGGAKRFDTQFHSLMFDLVGPQGAVHVLGMADTGSAGSICASPRQGKTVVTLPGTGCAITSLYEIWSAQLNLLDRATVVTAEGVFDPITILDPSSLPGQRPVLLTSSYLPNGPFFGCTRESYAGPVYLSNSGRSTTFTTDAYGGVGAVLTQYVSAVNVAPPGINMASGNPYQMKASSKNCAAGLGLKN